MQETILFESLMELVGQKNIPLYTDSRKAEAGGIFISLPVLDNADKNEAKQKQIEFLASAGDKKVFALVCDADIASELSKQFPQYAHLILEVKNTRQALGELAKSAYHTKDNTFNLFAVTGTNGKTTITYLLEYFLQAQHKKVGVLGTVSYRYKGRNSAFKTEAPLTTPDCLFLHSFLHDMQKAYVDYALMEVSSHAIDQNRIAGLDFDAAIFTQLTQDHLDYHKNMEEYFEAKSKLFLDIPKKSKKSIINADDVYGVKLLQQLPHAIAYTLKNTDLKNKTLFGTILSSKPTGLHLLLKYEDETWELKTPLIGQHNAYNLLAVMALALEFGYKPKDFDCFSSFYGVSGRLERVLNDKNIYAFVDYAHTPDALMNVLTTLRAVGFENIVTVFGCGGDRDKSKRPLMAEMVSRYSDISILTSDNPRTENPETIMDDVEKGLDKTKKFYREPDRKKALLYALSLIQSSKNKEKTVLLVAGKGHEPYQIIGKIKYPFSDQNIIKEALA